MSHVIIMIKEGCQTDLQSIATDLQNEGVDVKRVYPYGVIKGEVDARLIPAIERRSDVERVSIEKTFQLPSPDDDIQ